MKSGEKPRWPILSSDELERARARLEAERHTLDRRLRVLLLVAQWVAIGFAIWFVAWMLSR